MSFTRSCRAVGKDGAVLAIERGIHHVFELLKDRLRGVGLIKYSSELEVLHAV